MSDLFSGVLKRIGDGRPLTWPDIYDGLFDIRVDRFWHKEFDCEYVLELIDDGRYLVAKPA
jgi:hypothetical protein